MSTLPASLPSDSLKAVFRSVSSMDKTIRPYQTQHVNSHDMHTLFDMINVQNKQYDELLSASNALSAEKVDLEIERDELKIERSALVVENRALKVVNAENAILIEKLNADIDDLSAEIVELRRQKKRSSIDELIDRVGEIEKLLKKPKRSWFGL
jgi:septal ring factor EnvC (AmiA/AmiB activator)